MEFLADYVSAINRHAAICERAMNNIDLSLTTAADRLLNVKSAILHFDSSILQLNTDLKTLKFNQFAGADVGEDPREPKRIKNAERIIEIGIEKGGKSNKANSFLQNVGHIGQLADNTSKFLTAIEDQIPKPGKLEKFLETTAALGSGISNVAEILSVAEGGLTVAESIITSSKMMAGAVAIAAVSAGLGPAEWLIAATGIATPVVAGYISAEEEEKIEKRAQTRANRTRRDDALQNFEMKDADAGRYVKRIPHLSTANQNTWNIPISPVRENIEKYGTGAYDVNIPAAQAMLDKKRMRLNVPPRILKNSKENLRVNKSHLEETIDLQERLTYVTQHNGRKQFNILADTMINDAKIYDREHHTNKSGMVQSAVGEVLVNVLHAANDGKEPNKNYSKIPVEDVQHKVQPFRSPRQRVININLNKPMIGNFTINVRDVKDGINDFKHKVEEVLLEILNSANAIK